ncbi:MAG TPA: energy transducer TonB [Blastocatellia bacterium]|nr:energy transducer TonB [Blastocatellia bacterium]
MISLPVGELNLEKGVGGYGSRYYQSRGGIRRCDFPIAPFHSKMIRAYIITSILLSCAINGDLLARRATAQADKPASATIQARLRVAMIGLMSGPNADVQSTNARRRFEEALSSAFNNDARIALIDSSLVHAAIAGIGYNGSINLTKDEARRIGAAIGCDFFITGKAETLTRSERERESHWEAYVAVMIVDGRTGALVAFDFAAEKAVTQNSAVAALVKTIEARVGTYIDRLIDYRKRRAEIQPAATSASERIEELPEEGSPQAAGFTAPEFLNRAKPEYTDEAARADISATVEARAEFLASGEVGNVEIIRWAGFGLDESAERAIRQLKFKPAMRDGHAVSVRAVVRYNFRRVAEPALIR